MGWRYVMFTSGSLVFAMSLLRVTLFRLKETPKYLIGLGADDKVVTTLQDIAANYGRSCSLTLEELDACGVVTSAHSKNRFSLGETLIHLRGLFTTRKTTISTILIWVSWAIMGLA